LRHALTTKFKISVVEKVVADEINTLYKSLEHLPTAAPIHRVFHNETPSVFHSLWIIPKMHSQKRVGTDILILGVVKGGFFLRVVADAGGMITRMSVSGTYSYIRLPAFLRVTSPARFKVIVGDLFPNKWTQQTFLISALLLFRSALTKSNFRGIDQSKKSRQLEQKTSKSLHGAMITDN
jgi:hypothetical protein